MLFFLSLFIITSLFIIGNFISKFLNLDTFEKPIFAIGFLVTFLNYLYFNLNLTINTIFYLYFFVLIASLIYSLIFNKIKFNELKYIFGSVVLLLILFQLIFNFYGEQHFVFRGNQQDSFVYLSTALAFLNNTYDELISFRENLNIDLYQKYYLIRALPLIEFRPSVGLSIALLNNLNFIDIIFSGFLFKILCTILTLFSSIYLFKCFEKKTFGIFILSHCFVLSLFFFYNFEIDAFSLILSTPFLILILAYSFSLEKNLINNEKIFLVKYIILWSLFFIIYPNGAAVFMTPIAFWIIYILFKNKLKFFEIKKLFIYIILFLLIIAPTYKTTILYLFEEIQVGLGFSHLPNYWGYYGAFILGRDNPIHDPNIVAEIKNLWSAQAPILEIIKKIFLINIEKGNSFLFLNFIPSTLGYFHLTLSQNNNIYLNIILGAMLIYLNIFLLKKIFINSKYLITNKKSNKIQLFKFLIIFFVIFFLYLVLTGNIWSAIKLYFIYSPILFIFIFFNFNKSILPSYNIALFILFLLPIYKYSVFNNGIGQLDSFPSIIHHKNKKNTEWSVDREKLSNCNEVKYDIEDKHEKIYLSLIFDKNFHNKSSFKCIISKKNNKFNIKEIK